MRFRVEIRKVQHIERLSLELDLAENKITCVVGRNGVGKTTLIRALRNLSSADTFVRTAQPGIFSEGSAIRYWADDDQLTFEFDPHIKELNCRSPISDRFRTICTVELPIPHGERFNFFRTISQADREIRRQIILEEYSRPKELVEFLSDIYSSNKFQSLIETKVRGHSYFSILLNDGRYVREDYLSSGEYFLINLYRTIRGSARLIVVDEIDISLDAAAQVQLLRKLRDYCEKYGCNVLFTTHSLAMMRTLNDHELFYMERRSEETRINPVSYSYVKSLLFGFRGWDRYILTEDRVLSAFLESFIRRCCQNVFFSYKIIHVGGGSQVVDLLDRNRTDEFLTESRNVISVLDGDRKEQSYAREKEGVYFLPFENVEEATASCYKEEGFPHRLRERREHIGPKDLFKSLQSERLMTSEMIHEYICVRYEEQLQELAAVLTGFLTQE